MSRNRACEIEIITGDWVSDEAMRNECLERARQEGFDWFIIQDADEFYTENSWTQINKILSTDKYTNHFITTWYNFWKTPRFVLEDKFGNIKGTNAGFAIRCNSDIYFTNSRSSNSLNSVILDCPCYHYGYVKSNAEMLEKISTWGHANDFFISSKVWYQLKWESWNKKTRNLHPVIPSSWKRAVYFPLDQPEFAHHFEVNKETKINCSKFIFLKSIIYDLTWELYSFLKKTKKHLVDAIREFKI